METYEPVIGGTKVLSLLRSAARAARSLASCSALACAAARARASSLACASAAACRWAAAWASICSATESPMAMTGVSPVCSAADSAANAGALARVPTTPVVVRAATLATRRVVRWVRLGRRCFPVARVNAMEWLILSFLLAYRVS